MRSKSEMLAELTTMLRDVLSTRSDQDAYTRLARAHGYVDGYMRALLESGAVSRDELLSLLARERQAAGAALLLAGRPIAALAGSLRWSGRCARCEGLRAPRARRFCRVCTPAG